MNNLKVAYETGGYTALTVDQIVSYFKLDTQPVNFIYVLNCLDGTISNMLYLDQQAHVDPWKSRRDSIWEKFASYHEQYEQSQRTPPPIE